MTAAGFMNRYLGNAETVIFNNGESDTFKWQRLVLRMIMALKQICNHPTQYLRSCLEILVSG